MKKTSYKTALLSLAIAAVFSTAFTVKASANNITEPVTISLNYSGSENNSPAFSLNIFNAEETQFLVEVIDQNGVVLYSEYVRGNTVAKKFVLDLNDLKNAILTFKVTGNKTGEYASYEIDCNTKAHENWTAKKL
ncbi:hypothetical protein ACQ33O_03585 [Ferruginibacter sp. SUN002]|uniref:hypothetical protein n=1 Tax=Ferruginibacter sp. SUN002 TaxID=2937789 RepID=UPI003D366E83